MCCLRIIISLELVLYCIIIGIVSSSRRNSASSSSSSSSTQSKCNTSFNIYRGETIGQDNMVNKIKYLHRCRRVLYYNRRR